MNTPDFDFDFEKASWGAVNSVNMPSRLIEDARMAFMEAAWEAYLKADKENPGLHGYVYNGGVQGMRNYLRKEYCRQGRFINSSRFNYKDDEGKIVDFLDNIETLEHYGRSLDIQDAFESLPQPIREVLEQKRDGYKLREIAENVKKPVSTVNAMCQQGLDILRQRLRGY